MTSRIITSQDFLDDEIVEAKRAARDYTITLSREIEIDGEAFRVLCDGHHSLAAALADGVEPVIEDVCQQTEIEHDFIIRERGVEGLLEALHMGDDWRDAVTGERVW